jgi:hypothetical protein
MEHQIFEVPAQIIKAYAAGTQATCPPLACRRGTVVTCSRAIYPTVAPLQVRACLIVRARSWGRVRACRVVRARTRYACDAFASPASDAPSRARRLCRADARSSGEGATKRERVGRSELDSLLTDLWATGIFGHVLARVHTVRVPLDYL